MAHGGRNRASAPVEKRNFFQKILWHQPGTSRAVPVALHAALIFPSAHKLYPTLISMTNASND